MTRSILICLAVSAFSATAFVAGCGADDTSNGTPSGKGESCTRTADCKGGLVCIDATCVQGASEDGGGKGSGGKPNPGSGGSSGTTPGGGGSANMPPAPRLGKEGESCTRRADCAEGLACVLQTCTASGTPGGVYSS